MTISGGQKLSTFWMNMQKNWELPHMGQLRLVLLSDGEVLILPKSSRSTKEIH